LRSDERLDPDQVAWVIQRPRCGEQTTYPRWLHFLRSLLSGIYTIDNADFVLRDAYMSGYSQQAYDLDRLLHYSFFSPRGLTIHDRGLDSLLRFMQARAELFRTVYFHRAVRAIDLTLADLFADSKNHLFPGNPAEHLTRYMQFTEASLLVDVARWPYDADDEKRALGKAWQRLLRRHVPWVMVCQRSIVFSEDDGERSSIFSDPELVDLKVRQQLAPELRQLQVRVDIARAIFRPHTSGPVADQNFLYDSARNAVRPLTTSQLFERLPVSQRICRIYAQSLEHAGPLAAALDSLIGSGSEDDLTNM
jgi:HD superfamily phosphohydrolase